jgi:hypothetical protein
MRFRNRVVNPIVRLVLRSPVHRLLSGWLVILAYQGHKTGRWYSLPCMHERCSLGDARGADTEGGA